MNRIKTDEEHKEDAEFDDAVLGKNATLNEREALSGALTAALIKAMRNNEVIRRAVEESNDSFVERWTGNKSSTKKNTEEKTRKGSKK